MKKIKVLLTAVTVLTIVGGALAFKAAKFNDQFCTKSSSGKCTSFITSKEVLAPKGTLIWAVATTDTENCTRSTAPNCTSQIRLDIED